MPDWSVINHAKVFRIMACLPGISDKNVKVYVKDGLLTIQIAGLSTGKNKLRVNDDGEETLCECVNVGKDIKKHHIKVNLCEGRLTVDVPKSQTLHRDSKLLTS